MRALTAKNLLLVLAVAGTIAAAAGAAPAPPSIAGMTLAPADVPGAKVVSQGKVAAGGYVSAYQRTLRFGSPYGRSEIVGVQSEGKLASTATQVTTDLGVIQRILNSKAGRAGFVAGFAGKLGIKTSAVKLSPLRHPRVGDGTVELPIRIQLKTATAYESLLYMRVDRVFEQLLVVGARPIAQADSVNLARILQAHIAQQLTPVDVTAPTITGTAAIGQTLTASPGTWSNTDVKLTYQWQRCDATGASCTDIAGATTTSYTILDTDAGSTFEVVETATDRFGAPTASSAATAVVPVPPPPPPPSP